MASGDLMFVWKAKAGDPPSSNYATQDTRNSVPVLDFDASTEETAYFLGTLPPNYSGGGLTLTVRTMATSATSGDFKLGASIERRHSSGDDLDSDSFATEQTATSTTNGTSGIKTNTTITFSSGANMDSLAAGEDFRLKLARKAADASDTMTGDLEVESLYLVET